MGINGKKKKDPIAANDRVQEINGINSMAERPVPLKIGRTSFNRIRNAADLEKIRTAITLEMMGASSEMALDVENCDPLLEAVTLRITPKEGGREAKLYVWPWPLALNPIKFPGTKMAKAALHNVEYGDEVADILVGILRDPAELRELGRNLAYGKELADRLAAEIKERFTLACQYSDALEPLSSYVGELPDYAMVWIDVTDDEVGG